MSSRTKNIIAFILCGLVVASLVFLFSQLAKTDQNNQETFSPGNPFQGISFEIPPVQAIEPASIDANLTTPPLNTSEISLIAYYKRIGGWTLADTVPAFVSYFDGGNYYDGLVRVWDSETIGASSTVSGDTFLDIKVRVRADGWILAWFHPYEDDAGAIVWWGHTRVQAGSPAAYSTSLSRAMEIVFIVAGVEYSWPGYDMIGMYDYSEPSATRLLMFGQSIYSKSVTYYYTIPPNSTMAPIKLLVRSGGYTQYSPNSLTIDGGTLYDEPSGYWGWSTKPIFIWEKGIQHIIVQSAGSRSYQSVAFVMWTG